MPLDLQVGDLVITKKNHPCGSNEFLILRTGMDFRVQCKGCNKQIWLPRTTLEKRTKKVIKKEEA